MTLGLSTSRVSNLLKKALETGLVEINIFDPFAPLSEIENKLKEHFNLNYVKVVAGPFPTNSALKSKLGLYASLYLQKIVRRNQVIGISGGSTLHAIASSESYDTHCPVKVVPVLGGVSASEYNYTSNAIAAILADKLGGTYLQVPYPTFVGSSKTREAVMNDSSVKESLETARNAELMVVGIGSIPFRVLNLPHLQKEELKQLTGMGVVGEVAGHFLNLEGKFVSTSFSDQIIGIELEDIKRASTVMAVAGGTEKVNAITSALLSGIINVLIIDEPTALKIISDI